jgi:hypothetical protein
MNSAGILGHCEHFEEKQVGSERFNFFTGLLRSLFMRLIVRLFDWFIQAVRKLARALWFCEAALNNSLPKLRSDSVFNHRHFTLFSVFSDRCTMRDDCQAQVHVHLFDWWSITDERMM